MRILQVEERAHSNIVVEVAGIVMTGGWAFFGGGITARGLTTVIVTGGSVIHGNYGRYGGGLSATEGGSFVVDGQSAVRGNTAATGGGISAITSDPAMVSSILIAGQSRVCGNVAISNALGYEGGADGGGVYALGATITLTGQSAICENSAANGGGGIQASREMMNPNEPEPAVSLVSIRGQSSVYGNAATDGGAVQLGPGVDLSVSEQSSLHSNTAVLVGGAICTSETSRANGAGGLPASYVSRVAIDGASSVRNNSAASWSGGAFLDGVIVDLDSVIFDSNRAAQSATALFLSPREGSPPARNLTVVGHGSVLTTIVVMQDYQWLCPLGQWSPLTGTFFGDIEGGCAYVCSSGFIGNSTSHLTTECAGSCPPGHFCPAGSIVPTPCPAGLFLADVEGRRVENCIACSPGTYSASSGSAACSACAAGTLTEAAGASSCSLCPAGGFCAADGAASLRQTFAPCPAGYVNPSAGASSNASCTPCEVGKANPIPGSTDLAVCRDCLPGSFAAVAGTAICTPCARGTYQAQRGATSCDSCPRGAYCDVGTSTPKPCPGGTYSNATGIASHLDCVAVAPGYWSPLGSATPVACPTSGFTCPGRQADTTNDPPGSLPIQLTVGSISETTSVVREVPQLQTTLTLDTDVDAVDLAALRSRLAALYGVPEEDIQLSLGGGSVVVTVGIAAAGSTLDELNATITMRSDAELSSALGVNAVRTPGTTLGRVNATVVEITQSVCPPGSWCSAGYTFPCLAGRYNPYLAADNASACVECPGNSTTLEAGCTSISQCRCNPTFYDAAIDGGTATDGGGGGPQCQPCPVGTLCAGVGSTLRSLQVQPGYFRLHALSVDVQRCADAAVGCSDTAAICAESHSACRGGDDANSSCGSGISGAFCQLCAEAGFVYQAASATRNASCAPCAGVDGSGSVVGDFFLTSSLMVLGLIGAVCVISVLRHSLFAQSSAVHISARLWSSCRPEAKLKIVLGFYMIVARVESVYEAPMPLAVRNLLSFFRIGLSLGLQSLDAVLACMNADGYARKLGFTMGLPVALVLIIVGVCAVNLARERRLSRVSLVETALPATLRMWFVVYPLVTNTAFEAFACHQFDAHDPNTTRAFLATDVAIECSTAERASPEHDAVLGVAWAAVYIYAVGTMVLVAILLILARRAIQARQRTLLSTATAFLWREYEPDFFWWDLMEMLRRFWLVGFMVQFAPGTITQLAIGAFYSLGHMMLQVQCMPFRDTTDDYLSNACSLILAVVFLILLIFKVATLTEYEELVSRMSNEQRNDFVVPVLPLSFALVGCIVAVLALSGGMMAIIIARENAQRLREARASSAKRLRDADNKEVVAPHIPAGHYHTFLSHVWGTGQDQMRIVKQRLLELLPDAKVFLDVDDLEEIGDLEGYIDRTTTVLVYCSDGYFRSKNCMRELVSSTLKGKPIIALIDPDASRGGLTVEQVRERLVEGEGSYAKWGFDPETTPAGPALFDHLFKLEPIEWNRFGHFQSVTLRLIAVRMLQHSGQGATGPGGALLASGPPLAAGTAPDPAAPAAHAPSLLSSKSTMCSQASKRTLITPQPRYHVDGELVSIKLSALPPPAQPGAAYHVYASEHNYGAYALLQEVALERGLRLTDARASDAAEPRSASRKGRVVPTGNVLHVTKDPARMRECEHMLLYLTSQTWTRGDGSAALATELLDALNAGVHVQLTHEMPGVGGQEARYGCEFGSFFACEEGATPQSLLQRGIYSEIAVPLKGGPWREASMVLLGQALGMRREDANAAAAPVSAAGELTAPGGSLSRLASASGRRLRNLGKSSSGLGGAIKARCSTSRPVGVAPSENFDSASPAPVPLEEVPPASPPASLPSAPAQTRKILTPSLLAEPLEDRSNPESETIN